jgi:hypothetical protein
LICFFMSFCISFKAIYNGIWNCCRQFWYMHATFNKMTFKKWFSIKKNLKNKMQLFTFFFSPYVAIFLTNAFS